MFKSEEEIVKAEKEFEDSKAERHKMNNALKAAKGKYHTQLVARRESGEKLTISDMKALEDSAIDEIEPVKKAYLDFINADSDYRIKKVRWESAKREYWDSKGK